MLIWCGYGFFIPLLVFAILISLPLIIDPILGNHFSAENHWVTFLGLTFAGIILWFMGNALNAPKDEYYSHKTGETLVLRDNHSLYFIKMEYWGVILPLIGLVYALS